MAILINPFAVFIQYPGACDMLLRLFKHLGFYLLCACHVITNKDGKSAHVYFSAPSLLDFFANECRYWHLLILQAALVHVIHKLRIIASFLHYVLNPFTA